MLDIAAIRSQFPALARTVHGRPAIYADGPGGTQVPQRVIDAMSGFLASGGSNLGGPFVTSEETGAVVDAARLAVADLFHADPDEISFGQNMTSLTLAFGRALARTWAPGDEVICTRLDHDANVSSWMQAARDAGATVRLVDFDVETGRLDPAAVAAAINERTRLVAVTHASNAIGTIVDVSAVVEAAHDAGVMVFVDAVHYTPHGVVDVAATGCDFLTASAYKFFGPHTGALYGRREVMETLEPVKIRPAPDFGPGKWESGTQSFESLAGVTAAVDYLASLGTGTTRREQLVTAMTGIAHYEHGLSQRFLAGVAEISGVTVHGVAGAEGRTPTFAVDVAGQSARRVAEHLGSAGVFVWDGHYYALEVMRHLGVLTTGGLVRIGFAHYNTEDEVDQVVDLLAGLVG